MLRATVFSSIDGMKNQVGHFFQRIFLGVLVGGFAGGSAATFLFLLNWVTDYRESHPLLIWAMPLGGLMTGFMYWHFGKAASGGNVLVIDAIHEPKKGVPLRMAPLILVSTVLTHLFGGSAGREGAAVQMSASLSVQLAGAFHLADKDRRILLMAGTGAGFGATVGAPWAGFIFGLEVLRFKGDRLFAALECWVASFVGYGFTRWIGAPHPDLTAVRIPDLNFYFLVGVLLVGISSGVVARGFIALTHAIQKSLARLSIFPPLVPAGMGMVLPILYFWEGSLKYAGLGLSTIESALHSQVSILDPIYKWVFTGLTVGSGFKGGEYVPLVFIGSTLGNALGQALALPQGFLAALGYVAVFGGAAQTPLACACLAMELFGSSIGPFALVACGLSFWLAGEQGIYHRSERLPPRRASSRKVVSTN